VAARRAAATLAKAVRERSLPRSCATADRKAKRAFAHLGDAQEAADRTGGRLMPYHCPNCEMWHLTTRRGHTGNPVAAICPRCGNEFSWTDKGRRGHGDVALDDPGFCNDCWESAGA
jgi:hypothetical protein